MGIVLKVLYTTYNTIDGTLVFKNVPVSKASLNDIFLLKLFAFFTSASRNNTSSFLWCLRRRRRSFPFLKMCLFPKQVWVIVICWNWGILYLDAPIMSVSKTNLNEISLLLKIEVIFTLANRNNTFGIICLLHHLSLKT